MTTEFLNLDSAFFRMAMDSCPELVFVKDNDFRMIYANKSMLDLYSPEMRAGVIGSTTIESFSKEEADVFLAKDRETFATGASTAVEEIFSYTGQMRTFSVNKTRFVDTGGGIRLLGIATDISESVDRERKLAKANMLLHDSEARFRLITEQASDVISLHDADHTTLFISPAIRTVIGYEPEDIIGQTLWNYVLPEDHDLLINQRRKLAERDFGVVCRSRLRMLHRNGTPVWVEVASRLTNYDGQRCTIAVFRDVTGQVEIEAALRKASEAAEAATAAKSSFLATMSHEIRTPMTGVLGMIELLRSDDVDPEERERFFSTLEQSAKTLMTVLDDILDYSKIEAGSLALETVDFDIAALSHGIGDLFRHTASAKGLTFSVSTLASDHYVRGDPTRIQQILSNLVTNAIKFTETGGITITVGSVPASNSARLWRIEVTDTGVGLGTKDSRKLFSPFVQADESTTRRFGGTGLGLAISKRLIDTMGGEIGAQPRAEGGSTFWFELSLETSKAVPFKAKPATDHAGACAEPLRVLIAEDNSINQLLLTALLRRLGHHSTCVANGELAVSEIQSGYYDVILMDMQMPVMDGVAATRAIRGLAGDAARIPIIALTADALPERRRFYENIGLTEFLTKPVDVNRLAAALGHIMPRIVSPSETRVAAPLDIERLAELRSVLAEETIIVLLEMIAYEASAKPAIIRNICEAGELTKAIQEAHGLKGAAGNVGANQLAEVAAIIEKSPDITTAISLLPRLELAAIALLGELEIYKAAQPVAEYK